jgi:hypothetical protein
LHAVPPACTDLDHLNEDLRSHLKDWLNHLKDDVGFEGWRFDFVKGYGPQFVKEYVADTVGADTFNVGEYWVDLRCGPGFLTPPGRAACQAAPGGGCCGCAAALCCVGAQCLHAELVDA